VDRGNIIVNLGQAEAVLNSREQVSREHYKRGDRIRAYILDVLEEARGAQVILSRVHADFVARLFAAEVPEISEGIVSIKGAAREAGVRSKIAVSSSDSDVDPVGACVGMKGNRVQNIVQELRGEKIDIVPWSPDVAKFVCNALAPAEITRVIIDEDNKSMEVIVGDEFLSIAIGKNGQNVRLACRLTGWHLEVMSEKEYSKQLKKGYDALMTIPEMKLAWAEGFYSSGFSSPDELSRASLDDLCQAAPISESDAEKIINNAGQVLDLPENLEETPDGQGGETGSETEALEEGPADSDDPLEGPAWDGDQEEQKPANGDDRAGQPAASEAQVQEELTGSDDGSGNTTGNDDDAAVDPGEGISREASE
ncbi:MAG TPA: transcription termination factor NusA, partial [Desulfobacteraceae bacterium]|nr:transcription termination factor NusA [Desulfobacteraceae bacterium]